MNKEQRDFLKQAKEVVNRSNLKKTSLEAFLTSKKISIEDKTIISDSFNAMMISLSNKRIAKDYLASIIISYIVLLESYGIISKIIKK